MLIRGDDGFLEMVATERIADKLPTLGDTKFKIRVRSFGFAGQGWTWIDALSLISFVEQLRKLENQRHGSAELESMSPNEFRLRIYSTDSLGHVALSGRLSRSKHLLEFGFSFDPSLLPIVVNNFEAIANRVFD